MPRSGGERMSKHAIGWMALALLAGTTACKDAPGGANASANAVETGNTMAAAATAGQTCPDEGDRLALTGLCRGRAVAYLNGVDGYAMEAPEGCEWQVAETEMAGGDVMLYRALKCGTKAAQLEYGGGAERAELQLTSSAMEGKLAEPRPVVYMYVADGDPAAAVTQRARSLIESSAEAAKCNARPARVDSWPKDAMVVDTDPKGSSTPDGSPVAVCGDGGYFDEATRFWRVAQGYAYLFDFGQDLVEIDPASLTLMARSDEDGQWHAL